MHFTDFISRTILERVQNGSLTVWGKVNEVDPPYLVVPITIEPNKPRMCHDERFLNLWIKDCPFSLDYISDLPRYVGLNHLQTTFDDKSGYDHVRLHPNCRTFFGLEWNGWFFVYTTLPFDWKASAYIYHSIGLCATSFIRSLGVPSSQYIDDRHIGQLEPRYDVQHSFHYFHLAEMAAFIACSVLISLGYFIGLKKRSISPRTAVRFLGYICDSEKQAFILPEDKRQKFSSLREQILNNKTVSLKNLQKFSGKTTSFALVVPAAKLFTNCSYQAISQAQKSSSTHIRLSESLRNELTYWRFLDSWSGFLPWLDEKHLCVSIHTDASNTGWGGILDQDGRPRQQARGYWSEEMRRLPIAIREATPLQLTVESLLNDVRSTRIDAFVFNKAVVDSWHRQTSKSPHITSIMKSVYSFCSARHLSLSVAFVPSKFNLADSLSRVVSDLDSYSSPEVWQKLDATFGPHSIDLMALPENVRHNPSGRPLRFFAPVPCPGCSGVNIFSQAVSPQENAYVFPPFTLIGPVLKYLRSQACSFTFVVPDLRPRKYWWPILRHGSFSALPLGKKGDLNVLFFPSKSHSSNWVTRPLQWDLWAFKVLPAY